MKKRLLEHAQRYLEKSADDENLLAAILNNRQISDEIFGFHAQQAIEKLLKAALTVLDVRVGKVHDLRRLMDDCANAGEPLPKSLLALDILTPYGVVGRYENVPFKHPFTRQELYELVKEFRKWVEGKVH